MKDTTSKCVAENKNILWFCDACIAVVNNNLKILPKISDLESKTENLIKKLELFENKQHEISSNAANSTKQKSYASALKKSQEGIIIVKPNGENITEDDGLNMKEDIQKKINPGDIGVGIKSIKNTRNGAVIIKVRDEKEAQRLQVNIEHKLANSVSIKIPEKKNPCIKIVGIGKDYEEEELINTLKGQNNSIITEESNLKVKVTKKMVKAYMSIIECDPMTFQKIMLKSEGKLFVGCRACRVFEHIGVLRCYNCSQYGHTSAECKNKRICSKCNSTDHEIKECNKRARCTNCCLSNNDHHTKYEVNHSSFDIRCPVYINMLNKMRPKICYQQ